MIRFNCAECGKSVAVSDESAGRKGRCPRCGAAMRVPVQSAEKHGRRDQPLKPVAMPEVRAISRPQPAEIVTFVEEDDVKLSGRGRPTSRLGLGYGTASVILGTLSLLICWLPYVNVGLSGLGLLLGVAGIVAVVTRGGAGFRVAVAGTSVAFLGLVLGGSWPLLLNNAVAAEKQRAQESRPVVVTPPFQSVVTPPIQPVIVPPVQPIVSPPPVMPAQPTQAEFMAEAPPATIPHPVRIPEPVARPRRVNSPDTTATGMPIHTGPRGAVTTTARAGRRFTRRRNNAVASCPIPSGRFGSRG